MISLRLMRQIEELFLMIGMLLAGGGVEDPVLYRHDAVYGVFVLPVSRKLSVPARAGRMGPGAGE